MSAADLDLTAATSATKAIGSLIDGLRYQAPEDGAGLAARLQHIASRLGALAAALKITPPPAEPTPDKLVEELQQSLRRHRETERRHRDQRAQVCELLGTHWDRAPDTIRELQGSHDRLFVSLAKLGETLSAPVEQIEHRAKELIEDRRYAIDLFGAVRAMAAAAGLDPHLRPVDMVTQLAEERRGIHLAVCITGRDPAAPLADAVRALVNECQAARTQSPPMLLVPPHDPAARLIAIHEALNASGLTPVNADPLNPIGSVKRLIEERCELLEEMARGASPEAVAVAASELTDQAERGEDVPWTDKQASAPEPPPDPPLGPLCESCREKLCSRCNRCHSVAGFMRGCELADPSCDREAAPVDVLPGALRIAHEALISVIATSERDWTRAADLAWIYGVLVGWSPDDLEEMQIRFAWREQTVQLIEEHRGALVCAGMAEGA